MIWYEMTESNGIAVMFRRFFSPDFFPKFAKATVRFLSTHMGKIIRCHRDTYSMILRRKARRIEGHRENLKNGRIRCDCLKCTNHKLDQRKRVMSADFLASVAYNHRLNTNKRQLKTSEENVLAVTHYDDSCPSTIQNGHQRSSAKDVKMNSNVSHDWWVSLQERQRYMPPLKSANLSKPTRSECSYRSSEFHSKLLLNVTKNSSQISVNEPRMDQATSIPRSDPIVNSFSVPRLNGSKSESKNLSSGVRRNCEATSTVRGLSERPSKHPEKVRRQRVSVGSGKCNLNRKRRERKISSLPADCAHTRRHSKRIASSKSI